MGGYPANQEGYGMGGAPQPYQEPMSHGPYQPNYGNQFNIDSLTLNMEAPAFFNSPAATPTTTAAPPSDVDFDEGDDEAPLAFILPSDDEAEVVKKVEGTKEEEILKYLAKILNKNKKSRSESGRRKNSPMLIKLSME